MNRKVRKSDGLKVNQFSVTYIFIFEENIQLLKNKNKIVARMVRIKKDMYLQTLRNNCYIFFKLLLFIANARKPRIVNNCEHLCYCAERPFFLKYDYRHLYKQQKILMFVVFSMYTICTTIESLSCMTIESSWKYLLDSVRNYIVQKEINFV